MHAGVRRRNDPNSLPAAKNVPPDEVDPEEAIVHALQTVHCGPTCKSDRASLRGQRVRNASHTLRHLETWIFRHFVQYLVFYIYSNTRTPIKQYNALQARTLLKSIIASLLVGLSSESHVLEVPLQRGENNRKYVDIRA